MGSAGHGTIRGVLAIILGLVSAAAYGASDFVAGLSARFVHYAAIALLTQIVAATASLVIAFIAPGTSDLSAWAWGALSGLGSGLGTIALYRGLATGQMNVVAPISAAVAAVIPVAVGLASGERPSLVVLGGIAVLLPAIALISTTGPADPEPPTPAAEPTPGGSGEVAVRVRRLRAGALDGVLAGIGFGALFVALSQASDTSGMWPSAAGQLAALLTIAVYAALTIGLAGAVSMLRDSARGPRLGAIAAGVGSAVAIVAYLIASRHGFLVVVSVLTSLYPAGTVLLARLVLHERASRLQGAGLALAACGVALVAAG
ncbi:EamA family transporter [Epidermidibacterium keratini]